MKKVEGLFIIIIFLITSCTRGDKIENDCIEQQLEKFNMVEYTGQELDCHFFLELYSFKNKQYFLLENHCADIAALPLDCDGNKLCDNDESIKCNNFYKKSQRIGIVGIRE